MQFTIVPREEWASPEKVTHCQNPDCKAKFPGKFDLFNAANKEKKHCSCCGLIFCQNCLRKTVVLPPKFPDPVPACYRCCQLANAYIERQNAKALKNAAGIEAERVRAIANESFALQKRSHEMELESLHTKDKTELEAKIREMSEQHNRTINNLIEKYQGKISVLEQELEQVNDDHLQQMQGMKASYEERIAQLQQQVFQDGGGNGSPYGSPSNSSSPNQNDAMMKNTNTNVNRAIFSPEDLRIKEELVRNEMMSGFRSVEDDLQKQISELERQLDDEKMKTKELAREAATAKEQLVALQARGSSSSSEITQVRKQLHEARQAFEQQLIANQQEAEKRLQERVSQAELETTRKLDGKLEDALKDKQEELAQLKAKHQEEIESLRREMEEKISATISEKEKEVEDCKSLAHRVSSMLEKELNDEREAHKRLEREVEVLETETIPRIESDLRKEKEAALQAQNEKHQHELKTLSLESESKLKQLQDELESTFEGLKRDIEQQHNNEMEINSKTQRAQLDELVAKHATEISRLNEKLNEKDELLSQQQTDATSKISALNASIALLEAQVAENAKTLQAQKQESDLEIGRLTQEVETLQKTMNQKTTSFESQIQQLLIDSQSLNSQLLEAQQNANQHQTRLQEELQNTIENFEAQMQTVLIEAIEKQKETETQYQQAVVEIESKHASELSDLGSRHQEQLHTLQLQHRQVTESVRQEFERDQLSALEKQKSELEIVFKNELSLHLGDLSDTKEKEIAALKAEVDSLQKQLESEHDILIHKIAGQQKRIWRLEDEIVLKLGGKVPALGPGEDGGSSPTRVAMET